METRTIACVTFLIAGMTCACSKQKTWIRLDQLKVEGAPVDVYYKEPDLTSDHTSKMWTRYAFPGGLQYDALREVDCNQPRYRTLETRNRKGRRTSEPDTSWQQEALDTATQELNGRARTVCN